MSKRNRFGVAILAVVAVGVLALGWQEWRLYQRPTTCGFCQRPLRDKLRVIAELGGKPSTDQM